MSGKMGERYNNGKPMLSLIPAYATEEVAKVLTYGATKYSKNNWLKGRPWMEFVDSLERHLQAWKRGEDLDPESGCLHAAHIACNALMLVELIKLRPDLDDRPLEFYLKGTQKPEENQQAEKPVPGDTLEAKLAATFQESDYYIALDNSHFTKGDLLLIENWYDESASSIWCTIRIADFVGGTFTRNTYNYKYTVESTNAPAGHTWDPGTVVKRIL